ncbi:MAG TPA: hypothetical protein VH620_05695 [Gaiella sp.]|jgi:hypothetical protein
MGTKRRIAVSLSASVMVVAAVAGTAGARIPEADFGDAPVQVRPAMVAVPDAFDRAVQRKTRTLEAKYASADAVARAIARRNR